MQRYYNINNYITRIFHYIYIVTSNKGYAKAYSYYSNKLFHEYVDKEEKNNIFKMMINHYVKYKICIGLKTSSSANKIKFYNFFKGDLIKTIILDKDIFSDVIFWNYFFLVGLCVDKKIRFVDVEKEEIIDSLSNKKNKENFLIKKIMHPKYGECIISQEVNKEALKLWGQKL